MKKDISMSMIVREDPFLEKCILSFRYWVKELIIIITSHKDEAAMKVARKYSDYWEVYEGCNDEKDQMANFPLARNRALSLCSNDWIMWIDSDDLMVGGENLQKVISSWDQIQQPGLDAVIFAMPYQYSYHDDGTVKEQFYRERLLYKKENFTWEHIAHEAIAPMPGKSVAMVKSDLVIYQHQRQYNNPKPQQTFMNKRILQKYFDDGGRNGRNLYHLAMEHINYQDFSKAKKYLKICAVDPECEERELASEHLAKLKLH